MAVLGSVSDLAGVSVNDELGHAHLSLAPSLLHLLLCGLVVDCVEHQLTDREEHTEAIGDLQRSWRQERRSSAFLLLLNGRSVEEGSATRVRIAHGDEEVEADEGVGSPAGSIEEGGHGEEERHVLHALRLDHQFLQIKMKDIDRVSVKTHAMGSAIPMSLMKELIPTLISLNPARFSGAGLRVLDRHLSGQICPFWQYNGDQG